jgi:hypothetical protein
MTNQAQTTFPVTDNPRKRVESLQVGVVEAEAEVVVEAVVVEAVVLDVE